MALHRKISLFFIATFAVLAVAVVSASEADAQKRPSTVVWDTEPWCAPDSTSGITALVKNNTGAEAGYIIDVRAPRAKAPFVHASHEQFLAAGEEGRIILGGILDHTYKVTIQQNGQTMSVSTIMTFRLAALDCSNPGQFPPSKTVVSKDVNNQNKNNPAVCDGEKATIAGTPGNDIINGTSGPDVIAGLAGDDEIHGLDGDDIICGGLGDDVLYGGKGFDVMFGAQGDDFLSAIARELGDLQRDALDDSLREDTKGSRMFGGAGNDVIHGSNKWDRVQGGPGADHIYTYKGRDWLRAGPGNDIVNGGEGVDDMHGGSGKDDIAVSTNDIVRGGAGADLCKVTGKARKLLSCGITSRK